tara:strand:+ start:474 stop:1652 length:1179 start_codon:yes stop_codon:yes gene_type:complete
MARETYFSPGTAPLEKFARGVYDAFPRNLEEANQMFNPIELLREAGGKSGRFFESGGRDRQAGIGALIDTLTLGAGPASVGLASLFRTPIKKGTDFATDALQEAFNPLGASDDRVVDTGKKGMTRRGFLGGTGAAMALAGAPILREAGDLLPEKGMVKTSTDLFRQSLKNSNAAFNRIIQLKGAVNEAAEAKKKSTRDAIDRGLADPTEELFAVIGPKPEFVKNLEKSQDVAVEALNKNLSEFVKDLTREKLLKLSDEELIILNKLKHVSPHKTYSMNFANYGKVFENAGEPLRARYIYDPEKDLQNLVLDPESVRISELIDSVLIERDLFDRFVGLSDEFKQSTAIINDTPTLPVSGGSAKIGKAQGGVVSLAPEARNMFNRSKGIKSLIV